MKIEKFTLDFLKALTRNNNREWFLANKSIYEESVKKPMEELVSALAEDFAKFAPEHVASPKTSIYRIYRDTRFSKDKTPYKTHIAAIFPRKGFEKHEGAGLYLHIGTDDVLIAGGVYMPMPEHLNAIRTHIAANHRKLQSIVESRQFHKLFDRLSGEQLTRVPRGFPADHEAADYLRHKQFLAGRSLDPVQATSKRFYKTVVETFQEMMPLIRFLNEPIVRERQKRDRQSAVLGL